jgi:acetyl esterase/lipase
MDDEIFIPPPQLGSDRKKAIKKLKCLVYTSKRNPELFREKLDEAFYSAFLPQRVECREFMIQNISCDLLSPNVYMKNRMIVYIHGGSFIGGSSKSWRSFCASLAASCASRVVVANYRLAPSYAFPAACEDVGNVFRDVYEKESGDECDFIIAADGSGASLALALIHKLDEETRRHIKQVVFFSPWLDMSPASCLFAAKKNADEVISTEGYKNSAELYTYISNLTNPLVSPIYIADEMLSGFPSMYIQMGAKEVLLADVERFCAKLKTAGVPYILDVWDNMMHSFQMADEYLAESHLAIERVGNYVKQRGE